MGYPPAIVGDLMAGSSIGEDERFSFSKEEFDSPTGYLRGSETDRASHNSKSAII